LYSREHMFMDVWYMKHGATLFHHVLNVFLGNDHNDDDIFLLQNLINYKACFYSRWLVIKYDSITFKVLPQLQPLH
jgi:hypothetical protein